MAPLQLGGGHWESPGISTSVVLHFQLFDQPLVGLGLIRPRGKFLKSVGLSSSSHGYHVRHLRGSQPGLSREPTFVSRVGGEGGGAGDDTLIVVVLLDGVRGHEVVEAAVVSGVVVHLVVVTGAGVWQSLRVYL